MFTGIVQGLGLIKSHQILKSGCQLAVDISTLDVNNINIGDSICVNGACLTVTKIESEIAHFDVSTESLSKTRIASWRIGQEINLELALTLQSPLGGHLVTGHIDGIAIVHSRKDHEESTTISLLAPAHLGQFIAPKGSICIDGVSLTSNHILEDNKNGTIFSITLIPHTLSVTSLNRLKSGSHVHLEIDTIARYLHRQNNYQPT